MPSYRGGRSDDLASLPGADGDTVAGEALLRPICSSPEIYCFEVTPPAELYDFLSFRHRFRFQERMVSFECLRDSISLAIARRFSTAGA